MRKMVKFFFFNQASTENPALVYLVPPPSSSHVTDAINPVAEPTGFIPVHSGFTSSRNEIYQRDAIGLSTGFNQSR
jgi:hypothetical protein